ncbi:MAG TPA: hypothetical protein VFP68_17805 [Burkholderiaceae bacterium]|nr:hypothetical protein [Burkholderiaceae bacterium]
MPVTEEKGGRKNHGIALFNHPEGAAFLRVRFPQVTHECPAALSEVRVWARAMP